MSDGIMQDPSDIAGGEDAGFVAWLAALSENSSLPDQVGLAFVWSDSDPMQLEITVSQSLVQSRDTRASTHPA